MVDDNPVNLEELSYFLYESGFDVLRAETGENALEQAVANQPDLILLDVLMPGMDGFTICRQLKDNLSTQDIPVLFMTALADTADKVKGFHLGAVDYITKPFQYEEVIARVQTHITLQKLKLAERERLHRSWSLPKGSKEVYCQPRCRLLWVTMLPDGANPQRKPAAIFSIFTYLMTAI